MTYTLITQLGLALALLALVGCACYARGLANGRRLGAQAEQAYAYRTHRLGAQKRVAWWIGAN